MATSKWNWTQLLWCLLKLYIRCNALCLSGCHPKSYRIVAFQLCKYLNKEAHIWLSPLMLNMDRSKILHILKNSYWKYKIKLQLKLQGQSAVYQCEIKGKVTVINSNHYWLLSTHYHSTIILLSPALSPHYHPTIIPLTTTTADEWKAWLFYWSPIILYQKLPHKFYCTWILFVNAIRILSQFKISLQDFETGVTITYFFLILLCLS